MEISEAYDRLPYPSKFFNLTNPDHLAAVAMLLGLEPAPPEKCTVLELGCGNGSNLIAHAYNLKESQFVGVDISGGHIEAAERSAEELGIKNTKFRQMDVKDLSEKDFGRFDYIIAHGLISWIPLEVRDRIFEVYGELLNENGIGYISYNAYPGARQREMIRDVFRYHTEGGEEPEERVRGSLEILEMLAGHSVDSKIHRPIFTHEFERHSRHSVSDIFHDELADHYHPLHFYEFNELLERNGLKFLSEAEYHAMSMGQFSEEVREFADGIDDLVRREQYLDYFRGRAFRQTLFCRNGLEIERAPDPSLIERFYAASSMKPDSPEPDLSPGKVIHFTGNRGQGIQIDHPLTKAALCILGQEWGRPVHVPILLQSARQLLEHAGIMIENDDSQESITRTILFRIFEGTDLLEFHTVGLEASQTVSDRPKLNRLARWQLESARNVTSLFGLNVGVRDEVSAELLRLADGTRTHAELLAGVEEFIDSADKALDRTELPDDLESWMNESLSELAKLGVFEA